MDKHGQIDMLHGPIWNKLPRFALPIAATAILEQLFNASDVAVVGNFTGGFKTIAVAAGESAQSEPEHQAESIDRVEYWAAHPEDSPYEFVSAARHLAVVAESVAPGGGMAAQESVMWCVLNRVDSAGFPDTVAGVCTQPYQWQGYSQSVQYSSDTYTLAGSVLRRWYDGETGNIPADSVFMEVTEHGLKYRRLFRDTESVKIYFVGYGTPPDKALHST